MPGPSRPTVCVRRRGRALAYWNGSLWAAGTGLASSPLVIYLAMEFGAVRVGLGISLIKAAPHLAGLLRLAAPAMIGRLADRKRFCLGSFFLSIVLLVALLLAAAPCWGLSPGVVLATVVLLWCLYHLMEYLGAVALWSWFADLAPIRVRGQFLGRRERVPAEPDVATRPGRLAPGLRGRISNGQRPVRRREHDRRRVGVRRPPRPFWLRRHPALRRHARADDLPGRLPLRLPDPHHQRPGAPLGPRTGARGARDGSPWGRSLTCPGVKAGWQPAQRAATRSA